ncbi:MAG: SIS domain-containing protein [Chloroflexi bacterium]|nr:SIS domain-containing protein [Chloroflexota bacterium]
MSAEQYLDKAGALVRRISETQLGNIRQAAGVMADSVAAGGVVNLFGSGHSVLPVMDVFPRYGSYPAFRPLIDSRLSWTNVLGSSGVSELLWLERTEGYIRNFLQNYPLSPVDTMVVYSHGGLNAAPVEVALYARERGLKVVAVTSAANLQLNRATHSSGKRLADVADVVIDNCVDPIDSMVEIDGWPAPVAAGSTLAVIAITMALTAELAAQLSAREITMPVFVSPNITSVPKDNNQQVFEAYRKRTLR